MVLMRVALGVWFIWSAIPKLHGTYITEEMPLMLRYFQEEGAVYFYKPFLLWASKYATVLGYLTSWGEVAVGVALILGALTTFASIMVVIVCANYFLATKNLGPAPIGLNFLCIMLGIGLIIGQAGRYLSIDSLIGRKS